MRKDPGSAHRFGRAAEQAVARHLEDQGLQVLADRYRGAGGEVDVVARDGQTLVFVEVKARRNTRFGEPMEAVDLRKRRRIRSAAAAYLRETRQTGKPTRFDVVAVVADGAGAVVIDWTRDAFRSA